jgi:polar amino acid transport system permease protein
MLDNFDRLVWGSRDLLLEGLAVTAQVCGLAFPLALALGLAACLVRLHVPALRPLAIGYIEFFRATPIFVQLLWVNYVWPEVLGFPTTVMGAGVTALALQSSGYLAETFRAGIEGLPRGQREAGLALGMTEPLAFRRLVLPQALLVVAPSIVNQLAVIIKSSTLVSVIAIPDLMYQAMRIVNQWFEPIEVLTSAALIYVAVIFALSTLARLVAERLRRRYGLGGALGA